MGDIDGIAKVFAPRAMRMEGACLAAQQCCVPAALRARFDQTACRCLARLQAFTEHYYTTFDTARANLAPLYQDQSLLTFEGQKFQGTQQAGLLNCLPHRMR